MRVSPGNYSEATRAAIVIVSVLYAAAGALLGFSMHRLHAKGSVFIAAIVAAILICNLLIYAFQRLTLPKMELALQSAITARDGDGFARGIIRREMAKCIQPTGGIALSIGFLLAVIVSRVVR